MNQTKNQQELISIHVFYNVCAVYNNLRQYAFFLSSLVFPTALIGLFCQIQGPAINSAFRTLQRR